MKAVIGIDVGGSTTKIVGFTEDGTLIEPMLVRAADQITSVYGAFGKFTAQNGLNLSDITRVMMTGVGSTFVKNPLYGLPCDSLPEFECIGRGGLYLSGMQEAIVVSMGTGTALVHAKKGEHMTYLGGTGVGGGTVMGLSKRLLGLDDITHIVGLAAQGNLDLVDLRLKDITSKGIIPELPEIMTASNFGKLSDIASQADVALGILNMVFETIAMVSIFAARGCKIKDLVLTGNLSTVPQAKTTFAALNEMFHVNFQIPQMSEFGPAIGAALAKSTKRHD